MLWRRTYTAHMLAAAYALLDMQTLLSHSTDLIARYMQFMLLVVVPESSQLFELPIVYQPRTILSELPVLASLQPASIAAQYIAVVCMHQLVPAQHHYGMLSQVCEDWFTRMRRLLLQTSVAANAPHLTLHHAYSRLVDLKSQLRYLQAAAAAEAAQQLQEQLQAQTQQAQLEQARAAEQLAEAQASSQVPLPNLPLTAPDMAHANSSPVVAQQPQSSTGHQQQHFLSHQSHLHPSHPIKLPGLSPSHSAADSSLIGSPGTHSARQPPAASSSDAATPSQPAAAPVSLFTGKAPQASKPAPMGLLEIQAEQEAEAARSAEAARAVAPGRSGKGKPKADGAQPTRAAGAPQPGQPRVLQVGPSSIH